MMKTLYLLFFIAIQNFVPTLGDPCEVSDTLRQMKGEMTKSQLSNDSNKCLKESLYSDQEESFITKHLASTKNYDTVVSMPRRQATIELARAALALTSEGDFVETGIYVGGTSATMLSVLLKYDNCNRKFWGFDSFQGLPENAQEDKSKYGVIMQQGFFAIGKDKVIDNLKKWGVYDESRIVLTKGFFNESLPQSPVSKISFLRADGDLFVSTWDALEHLYHKVVPGGFIYIDDYGAFAGCRDAVDRFRMKHHIYEPLRFIREDNRMTQIKFEAVWWQKKKKRQHGNANNNSEKVNKDQNHSD